LKVTIKRKRAQDFLELMTAANRAISRALADGDRGGKHPPGSWMEESIDEQLKHIEAHIARHDGGERSEDHLAHIVCRAAIAFALRGWEK